MARWIFYHWVTWEAHLSQQREKFQRHRFNKKYTKHLSAKESESHSVMLDSLWPHGLYSPWNSPGQNIGLGSLFPSPEDLSNTGIEPKSPTLQVDSLPAEPHGKPKNTGVGSLSLSSRSSWSRYWTRVFCIADGFLTNWAMREAHQKKKILIKSSKVDLE